MLKLNIDERTIHMPTSWRETTFSQYVDIVLGKKDFWWGLSVITNTPYEMLMKHNFTQGLDTVVQAAGFLKGWDGIEEYPKQCGPFKLGDTITTGNQLTAITQEIERAGRSGDMRIQLIQLCNIAAIYCQGINEPFDLEKADYLAKQMVEYPCIDILSCGNYFQAKALSISSGGRITVSDMRKKSDPPVKFIKHNTSWLSRLLKGR